MPALRGHVAPRRCHRCLPWTRSLFCPPPLVGEDLASPEQAQNLDYISEMLAPFKGGCLALSQAVGFYFFLLHSQLFLDFLDAPMLPGALGKLEPCSHPCQRSDGSFWSCLGPGARVGS